MYYVVSASVLCIVYVYSILYLASMYYVLLAFILCVLCTLSISHLTIPVVSILPRFGEADGGEPSGEGEKERREGWRKRVRERKGEILILDGSMRLGGRKRAVGDGEME